MAGRKRNASAAAVAGTSPRATRSSRARGTASTSQNPVVPNVVRQLLRETRSENAPEIAERPAKRLKRPGEKPTPKPAKAEDAGNDVNEDENEDGEEFEDVVIPEATVQTIYRDESDEDDEDEGEGEEFEDVTIGGELSLNLTAQKNALAAVAAKRIVERRKRAVGKEERERRVDAHKVHLLCLLAHVEQRNRWCNDAAVQEELRGLLTDKMLRFLNPRSTLIQFGQTESLKNGLRETADMWKVRYKIVERGLRRALWVEDEEQLKDYKLPEDAESTHDKSDFLSAAKSLRGSRDVGAQLYCGLLRAAGVRARLVCSLQPLSCVPSAPTIPKSKPAKGPQPSKAEIYAAAMAKYETTPSPSSSSPRRRLGHPNAAAYNVPSHLPPPTKPAPTAPKIIRGESAYPVYWVEVLDKAHQKWHPVDALVTSTQFKPKSLEPPASDTLNCLSYAIAFDADGSARDVTRRYAKAYNAKTKRMRVDGTNIAANKGEVNQGEKWWRRAMRRYRRLGGATDLDQIEISELTTEEAREPMPKNVADFKDHPVYALERHMRRFEVLVPGAQPSGTIGAGSKGPLEKIWRRRDVRVARSKERWWRLGRVIKDGEVAVKILPKRKVREDEDEDDDPDRVGLFGDETGTPIYMPEQTDLYKPPPVVGGKVPRNRFGNIDVYVPSMVPEGGAHVVHEWAARAAVILGVDYAPALTGFEFKGRKGTAVLHGAVVPKECEEGVWAAIRGLEDLEREYEEEMKRRKILRLWSRFLKGLRIRERVWAGVEEGEDEEDQQGEKEDKGKGVAEDEEMDAASDVSEEYFLQEDEEGGGFFVGGDDDDDDVGGGFIIE
ncbi:hypothetical protein OQA88_9624 [Cercophora sp. LCS_1]